jgi:hypothetical protein
MSDVCIYGTLAHLAAVLHGRRLLEMKKTQELVLQNIMFGLKTVIINQNRHEICALLGYYAALCGK